MLLEQVLESGVARSDHDGCLKMDIGAGDAVGLRRIAVRAPISLRLSTAPTGIRGIAPGQLVASMVFPEDASAPCRRC
jgi:hypothetical protein